MKIYLVGGAVRDQLLGVKNQDLDYVVVGETASSMLAAGFKHIQAASFPVFIKDGDEYALARKEKSIGQGHKEFTFSTERVTLEEDLYRRDLAINAIAQTTDGQLIDPYGGKQDIEARLLRHVSNSFYEDPLRVLRLARFAAQLDFKVAPETFALSKAMVKRGDLDHLTPERIWKETEKALKTKNPRTYFEVLDACGALEKIMPELTALKGVPQPEQHHPEIDTWAHTLMAVEQASKKFGDPVITFAVLVHDLGKSSTPAEILPRHYGHEKAGVPLVKAFCARIKVPNNYKKLALDVTELHLKSHRCFDLRSASLVRMLTKLGALKKEGEPYLKMFLSACHADASGRKGMRNIDYPQADFLIGLRRQIMALDLARIFKKHKGNGLVIGNIVFQERALEAKEFKKAFGCEPKTPQREQSL